MSSYKQAWKLSYTAPSRFPFSPLLMRHHLYRQGDVPSFVFSQQFLKGASYQLALRRTTFSLAEATIKAKGQLYVGAQIGITCTGKVMHAIPHPSSPHPPMIQTSHEPS